MLYLSNPASFTVHDEGSSLIHFYEQQKEQGEGGAMKTMTEAEIALVHTSSSEETINILMHYCYQIIKPDLLALYLYEDGKTKQLTLHSFRGYDPGQSILSPENESILFMEESYESICLLRRKESPFQDILLLPFMNGGFAVPLMTPERKKGILFLNYLHPYQFSFQHLERVETLTQTAFPHV